MKANGARQPETGKASPSKQLTASIVRTYEASFSKAFPLMSLFSHTLHHLGYPPKNATFCPQNARKAAFHRWRNRQNNPSPVSQSRTTPAFAGSSQNHRTKLRQRAKKSQKKNASLSSAQRNVLNRSNPMLFSGRFSVVLPPAFAARISPLVPTWRTYAAAQTDSAHSRPPPYHRAPANAPKDMY